MYLAMTMALRYLFFLLLVYIATDSQSEVLDDICMADGTCSLTSDSGKGGNRDGDGDPENHEAYNTKEENDDPEESGWEDPDCFDDDERCHEWATNGECEYNPNYMLQYCNKSCEVCCPDEEEQCAAWAESKECANNPDYMLKFCRKSCEVCNDYGLEQDVYAGGEDRVAELQHIVDDTIEYMQQVVMVEEKYEHVRWNCKNRNTKCAYWKLIGECEQSSAYMNIHCSPVCKTCELGASCRGDPSTNIWGPGDLNKMFQNITTHKKFQKYTPRILSRPAPITNSQDQTQDFIIGPWVVILENFITPEECEAMIELGTNIGYARSTAVAEDEPFAIEEFRTSSNAWCDDTCDDHPLGQSVIEKIESLTGIPKMNSEYLQLLKYTEGQFYASHHDYIDHEVKSLQGPRMITVFLYLNYVEEGGGTNFTILDLTVQPKCGKAVIWPSVLDESPDEMDARTEHEALPVIKGVKYGANAWLHQRDAKSLFSLGC